MFKIEENVKNEKVFDRWNKIGFLEGLDNELAVKVADEFEKVAKYIIITEGEYPSSVETMALPCVRRIFQLQDGPNEKYNPEALCEKLREELKKLDTDKFFDTDYEAMICVDVSKFFGNKVDE